MVQTGDRAGTELFDEMATLLEIERAIRTFKERYYGPIHANDEWQFHPGTIRLMEAISPLLEHLDDGRKSQGLKPAA